MNTAINLVEKGLVPDFLTRKGIKLLLKQRLKSISPAIEIKESNIAIKTQEANDQHYTVPTDFYKHVLGSFMKYSCCYYKTKHDSLTTAEQNSLDLVLSRFSLKSGQKVLELGCGWGSFSLYASKLFPDVEFTGISNSPTQKIYIDNKAKELGINNLQIITTDINTFNIHTKFDRIVSIEMLEHIRNHKAVFAKLNKFLNADGKIFIHVFCHKSSTYLFDENDRWDWMSQNFFSGGIMPSKDHLVNTSSEYFQLEKDWEINGYHYHKTSEDWLKNLDTNKDSILKLFKNHYPKENPYIRLQKWRMFFMACSELFMYNNGNEWFVNHYLFKKNNF